MTDAASQMTGFLRDYQALRWELRKLQQQFEDGARLFPDLFFEQIGAPSDELSEEAWNSFIDANRWPDDAVWERWEITQGGSFCEHYYGSERWFDQFQRLAENAVMVLREIRWNLRTLSAFPAGCRLELPNDENDERQSAIPQESCHVDWVWLLIQCAMVSTPSLRLRGRVWKKPDDFDGNDDDLIYKCWDESPSGGDKYPRHPFCVALQQNLFRSSAEAIRIWLQPDKLITVGDWDDFFTIKLPHIRGTTLGCQRQLVEANGTKPNFESPSEAVAPQSFGKLSLDGQIIKQFNQPADKQVEVLEQFQKLGWPEQIEFPCKATKKLEWLNLSARYREIVGKLNKGTKGWLRFRTVKGHISWELGPRFLHQRD